MARIIKPGSRIELISDGGSFITCTVKDVTEKYYIISVRGGTGGLYYGYNKKVKYMAIERAKFDAGAYEEIFDEED